MYACPQCNASCLRSHRFCPACGADISAPMRRSDNEGLINTRVGGRFVLREVIGTGGMGKVFRADQIDVGRTVAVKIMHGHLLDDATALARFTNEARAASSLNHPNSIGILDFGQTDSGILYIVMEYLKGLSLDAALADSFPMALGRVAFIVCQALDAIEAAHRQKVIHRDLKPENIFLLESNGPRDFIKVLDFGVAKMLDPGARKVTTPGLVPGTPEYMSPEQARGEALDARTDIYSMGVILYEMITNMVPFSGTSAVVTMMGHVQDPVIPPTERRPDLEIPAALESIVIWALAKKKEERIESAAQFRDVLSAWARVAGVWPAEFDARASSPDVLLDLFSAEDLENLPGEVASEQRILREADGLISRSNEDLSALITKRDGHLIGRSEEQREIQKILRKGGRWGVRIYGDPGIGRARLMDHLVRQATQQGARVFRSLPEENQSGTRTPVALGVAQATACYCLGLDSVDPEQLLLAASRVGVDAADIPGLKDLFSFSGYLVELDAQTRERERTAAFRHLIGLAAADSALILAFRDFDRIDPPSRKLILAVASDRSIPVGIVLTHAAGVREAWPDDFRSMELGPLDTIAAGKFVDTLTGPDADARLRRHILAGGGGHPLFLEQFAFSVVGGHTTKAPEKLADLIAIRVDQLAAEDRYLLQWLAVLDQTASAETLSRTAGSDVDPSRLDDLVDSGFLRENDGFFTFAHHLIAMVVYTSVPAEARREMHHAVAKQLRRRDARSDIVAHHAYWADEGKRAVVELERAGLEAERCGDIYNGVTHFTRALEIIRREWGRERTSSVDLDTMAVQVALHLARSLNAIGQAEMAEGVLEEVLSITANADESRARLLLALGQLDLSMANRERAVRHFERARTDAKQAHLDQVFIDATRDLARARSQLGEIDTAQSLLEEAYRASCQQATERRRPSSWAALLAIADAGVQIGAEENTESRLESALEAADSVSSLSGRLNTLVRLAEIQERRGDLNLAQEKLSEAYELSIQVGDRSRRTQIGLARSRIYARMGDHARARSLVDDALRLARSIRWSEGEESARVALANIPSKRAESTLLQEKK